MAKPDYATLLGQIAAETNPAAKQLLIEQCYQFPEELTPAEEALFDFIAKDYFEDTPGPTTSYIGIYYAEDGTIIQ